MSMPEFPLPNPDLTCEQALNMILSSIAMEELALSHILNAEGEKIQHVLGISSGTPRCLSCPADTGEILAVNKSVTALLEMVMQNQLILKNKMEKVLEYLPKPCAPLRPCPPPAPNPCPPPGCRYEPFACFAAIPGPYDRGCPIRWNCDPGSARCREDLLSCDGTSIQLPHSGRFRVCFALELCGVCMEDATQRIELLIDCEGREPVSKCFCSRAGDCRTCLTGSIDMLTPCRCQLCRVLLLADLPCGLCVKGGKLFLDRIL